MTDFATMSDPAVNRRRSRSWRVFRWLIISVGLIVAAGAVFQFSMTQWESHRYPPPGKLVGIGGLRLHINVRARAVPRSSWRVVPTTLRLFGSWCNHRSANLRVFVPTIAPVLDGVTRPMSRAVV